MDAVQGLELVECETGSYPDYWVVNRSARGIRALTFLAGCACFEHLRYRAAGVPPRSRFKIPPAFLEPGPQVSAIEELVWEDGTVEAWCRLARSTVDGEDELADVLPTDVVVEALEDDKAAYQRVLQTLGLA